MKKQKILQWCWPICTDSFLTLSLVMAMLSLGACGKKGDPKSMDCDVNQMANYKYPSLDETP